MTIDRENGGGNEAALEALKAAYRAIDPPDLVRQRVRQAVFRSRKPARRRRWSPALGWCAAAASIALAAALYLRLAAPGGSVPDEAPGAGDPGLPEVAARLGEVLVFGPHRVELRGDARLVTERVAVGDLLFHLESGGARFHVAPLPPEGRFVVVAGAVTVEVVGTVFTVERDDPCVRVEVEEGRVLVTCEGRKTHLAAGDNEEFCVAAFAPRDEAAADEPVSRPAPGGSARRARRVAGDSDDARPLIGVEDEVGIEPPAAAGLTEEERLYRAALEARHDGDVPRCRKKMRAYLDAFPQGLFVDQALFALVRLDYRAGDYRAVERSSASYLERNPGLDAKAAEVRVLRAESLDRLGTGGRAVLEALGPLTGSLGPLDPGYREQARYLVVRSAREVGDRGLVTSQGEAYLEEFPEGRYAERIRSILEKNAGQ